MTEKNNAKLNSAKHFIQKIIYIQEIIQNTIISIKNNKKSSLFSENDINNIYIN